MTGGSYPNTPQKPDDMADESIDDLKATIREAQASTSAVSCLVSCSASGSSPIGFIFRRSWMRKVFSQGSETCALLACVQAATHVL